MRLLFRDPVLRQQVNDGFRLDLEFAGQFVDSDLVYVCHYFPKNLPLDFLDSSCPDWSPGSAISPVSVAASACSPASSSCAASDGVASAFSADSVLSGEVPASSAISSVFSTASVAALSVPPLS